MEKGEVNGRYRASLRHLLAIAGHLASRNKQDWMSLARSCLEELRSVTGLSANLCMPSGKEMVYLLQAMATEDLVVYSPPGTRRPLHSSAIGKADLGSLPEPELDMLLGAMELKPLTPRTIVSAAGLKEHLEQARIKGYFLDDGETHPAVICLGVPVFDQMGRVVASIGISGYREEPAFRDVDALGALLRDRAGQISKFLGYSGAGSVN